ncbi:hypothetical protein GUJ93_ZPchr0007g4874 [Zizania palustris]|uniref:Chromo domain-containing protein n=1 Tax=Zizania palustris TaxID=103762 RepID=A0A8J5TIX3_ZIZPA|nr:hypothetical protein GUJ93_ZPchr0007g4874 [Zizania palustris]
MQHSHDKHRREVPYNVDDWVWLKLQQRSVVGVTTVAASKLGPKFYGPYKVLQRIGEVSYKLQLPPKARIHDVFHVALLKKFEGEAPVEVVPLPDILNGKVLPTPTQVVRARLNRGVWELLIQWKGQAPSDASWEQLEDFKRRFLEVQLTDELFVGEEGNVIDAFVGRKYT